MKCAALTLSGKPCSRMAREGSSFCYQHQQREHATTSEKPVTTPDPDWPTCLAKWQRGRILGRGTSGIVYAVTRDGLSAAAKLQRLTTRAQVDKHERELRNQEAFSPHAPQLIFHCMERQGKHWQAAMVMEQIEVELDRWLSTKRSPSELQDMVDQVAAIGRFCVQNKLTHGDLALFNVARSQTGRWMFIDFDRASTRVFRPDVDLLRLQMELLSPPKYRSTNTQPLHASNVAWLRKHALPAWKTAWKQPNQFNDPTTAKQWERSYEEYCHAAQIPCLG